MIKSKIISKKVEEDSFRDGGSEFLPAKDEQPPPRKKTLMEIFRSEQMRKFVKYLGRL